jgi:hypothetical protein
MHLYRSRSVRMHEIILLNTPFRFLELPRERRHQVYDELVAPAQLRVPIEPICLYYHTLAMPPSLLRVSYQVHTKVRETVNRHLRDPTRALPPATLSLDLRDTSSGLVPNLSTSNSLRIMLRCIHTHMESDRQGQAQHGTARRASFNINPRDNTGPSGIYNDGYYRISSRPAFELFLARMVQQSRDTDTVYVALRTTNCLLEDVAFLRNLLARYQHGQSAVTLRVTRGPLELTWLTALADRTTHPIDSDGLTGSTFQSSSP